MDFATPNYLFGIPLVILLLTGLYYLSEKSAQRKLRKFASSRLLAGLTASYSLRRKIIKAVFVVLATALVLASLARPQWGFTWEETKVKGIDVLIALDTSKSMLAEDIRPNRMERSKLAILDLLEEMQGDRIGLIAFAGRSFLQCPLTLDYNGFRSTLETIDTDIIPVGGTNIANAIAEAEATFDRKNNHKFLVLLTDGEDLEASGIRYAREAGERGMIIFCVGVGTNKGVLIPVSNPDGSVEFVRDEAGDYVRTSLDEETLSLIASASGGVYLPLGVSGLGLEEVYKTALETIPQEEREARLRKIPLERFQWPLAIALLFLLLEIVIGNRKRMKGKAKS